MIQIKGSHFRSKVELPYSMASLFFIKLLISYHLPYFLPLFNVEQINLLSTWVMTLFSQKADIIQAMIIFDRYIQEDDPLFIIYLCVAKIIQKE